LSKLCRNFGLLQKVIALISSFWKLNYFSFCIDLFINVIFYLIKWNNYFHSFSIQNYRLLQCLLCVDLWSLMQIFGEFLSIYTFCPEFLSLL
jgi:hypothetical protein